MCKYCKNYSTEELPVRTNCDILQERFIPMIADMGNGKEIVISTKGKSYGLPINFCPICGEQQHGNESFIEQYKVD